LVELMRCGALIGLAMLAQASPVFAHAFLERASPPVGSELAVAPPELSITFTEGVEPLQSLSMARTAPRSPRASRMSRPTATGG
jgi:methionine-rich copper-binding protein CopC